MGKELYGRDFGHLVYALETPDGETFYVGRSSSGLHRPRSHFRSRRERNLDDKTHRKVRSLLRKNQAPVIRVLQVVESQELLDDAEKFWIRHMQLLGEPLCNEWEVDPLSQTLVRRGWKHSRATRRRIGQKHKGRKMSRVTRLLLSKSQDKKKRPVVCLDTGQWFPSLVSCAKTLDLNLTRLWGVCHGRREFRTTKGLRFAFA